MKSWVGVAASTLISGTVASLAVTAALALRAKKEQKSGLQPIEAASHWLHGEEAGSYRSNDVSHTAVVNAAHHVSALFWAAIFQTWLATLRRSAPVFILRDE